MTGPGLGVLDQHRTGAAHTGVAALRDIGQIQVLTRGAPDTLTVSLTRRPGGAEEGPADGDAAQSGSPVDMSALPCLRGQNMVLSFAEVSGTA